jgi:hypothetical protein
VCVWVCGCGVGDGAIPADAVMGERDKGEQRISAGGPAGSGNTRKGDEG